MRATLQSCSPSPCCFDPHREPGAKLKSVCSKYTKKNFIRKENAAMALLLYRPIHSFRNCCLRLRADTPELPCQHPRSDTHPNTVLQLTESITPGNQIN